LAQALLEGMRRDFSRAESGSDARAKLPGRLTPSKQCGE